MIEFNELKGEKKSPKTINADELTPIEVQITSGNALFNCPFCENPFAVRNCEDFIETASEHLKNKLAYGEVREKGQRADLSYFTRCPICLKECKIDLEFTLENIKTIMLFSTKCVKKIKWIGLGKDGK